MKFVIETPAEGGSELTVVDLDDTFETRVLLEGQAIPRCTEWRNEHPEHGQPAPYCCSAYCLRCAGLRALNGDDKPLIPNEWLHG